MSGITKLKSGYQELIPLYDETPKSVFAAIAFSMCFIDLQEDKVGAIARLFEEWSALHANGIIRQKPPSRIKIAQAIAKAEARTT